MYGKKRSRAEATFYIKIIKEKYYKGEIQIATARSLLYKYISHYKLLIRIDKAKNFHCTKWLWPHRSSYIGVKYSDSTTEGTSSSLGTWDTSATYGSDQKLSNVTSPYASRKLPKSFSTTTLSLDDWFGDNAQESTISVQLVSPSRFSSFQKLSFTYESRKPKSSSNTKFPMLERSEVMEENSLLEDETGENESDELSEIWEVAGTLTVTPFLFGTEFVPALDSLFFDLEALASSFVTVLCWHLFLRVVCQWFFISLSVLPGNSAAIADHLQMKESSDISFQFYNIHVFHPFQITICKVLGSDDRYLPVTKFFEHSDDAFFFLWGEVPSFEIRP